MLGKLIDRLPDDALERIADPTAQWGTQVLVRFQDTRCLIGHAVGAHVVGEGLRGTVAYNGKWAVAAWSDMTSEDTPRRVGDRFDGLCNRFGVARVSRACRLRAERVLASRGLVPHEPSPQPAEAVA